MGTTGAQRLRRSAVSSQRARRSIKSIETAIGRTISSDTSNYTSSKETFAEKQLEFDFTRGLEKTYRR